MCNKSAFLVGIVTLYGSVCSLLAQHTSTTYQGLLRDAGATINGSVDLRFRLFDADAGGNAVGPQLSADNVAVVDGLFSTDLDFGAGVFNGSALWLEIAVRRPHDPSDTQPFETLSPRQGLTAAPFALHSMSSDQWRTSGSAIVNGNSGNVGVGTSDPQSLLQVGEGDEAAIRLGYNPQMFLQRDVANDKFRIQITGTGWSGNTLQLGRDDQGHDISLMGDTGIGTPTPEYRLDVVGRARVRQGSDSSAGLYFYQNTPAENRGFVGMANDDQIGFFGTEGAGWGLIMDIADGAVGIGESNPDARLHVQTNSASAGNNTAAFEAPSIGPHASHVHFGNDGDWYIRSASAAGEVILQDSGGDVGVGTNNPQAKLHVSGDLMVNGSSGDASVTLPAASISAAETAHEPGLASAVIDGAFILDGDPASIASRTITCPADGYIVANATVEFKNPSFNPAQTIVFGISTSTTGYTHFTALWGDSLPVTGAPVHVNPPRSGSAVFPVSAGSHTFYLLAERSGSGFPEAIDPHLILMYFPTAYGTVQGEQ